MFNNCSGIKFQSYTNHFCCTIWLSKENRDQPYDIFFTITLSITYCTELLSVFIIFLTFALGITMAILANSYKMTISIKQVYLLIGFYILIGMVHKQSPTLFTNDRSVVF